MGKFLTNVLMSDIACFSKFRCLKAPLIVDEKEAWKKRHFFLQPMAPFENYLFFFSKSEKIPFIDSGKIRDVILTSNRSKDYRVLRFLVSQALKICLEGQGFQKFGNFYSHNRYMEEIIGRFGLSYNVLSGITPMVSFKEGYCLISLRPTARIFAEIRSSSKSLFESARQFVITLCNKCPECKSCENADHKASRCQKISGRVSMSDVAGKIFDCPSSMVRIETGPHDLAGEYVRILERTASRTSDEYEFLSQLITQISMNGKITLSLGIDVPFSRLIIEGEPV